MSKIEIVARVFRFDPSVDQTPYFKEYKVPLTLGDSAMDVLDFIYQNLDGTVAYYDHAGCGLGICTRCLGKINGRPGLLCQTLVKGDITLEPLSRKSIIKDLVVKRKERTNGI